MLVCGSFIDDFLGSRCQADCFVESKIEVAKSKRIIKDNILPLMEKSYSFITKNIQIGISAEDGGKEHPEYPLRLLRESVNNSLAHRDYGINKYINISIYPDERVEIRNPGRFKKQLIIEDINHEIPIRRIIPGNPKAVNPKLAEVLKVFDKWEGRGYGMSTLTNAALDNTIDLPYYRFHSLDELSLVIPQGNLLDEKMELMFESFNDFIYEKTKGKELTKEHKLVLAYFYKSELENINERYTILLTRDNNHLDAINDLERYGLISKHDCSDTLNTIYVIDRIFLSENFYEDLIEIFGFSFNTLQQDYKDVLDLIYRYNNFSIDKYLSANKIGNIIWANKGNTFKIRGFEAFKRKIRNIVNKLSSKGYIKKIDNKPMYTINKEFNNEQGLFN